MTLVACGDGKPQVHATTDTTGFVSSLAPSAPTDSTLRIVITNDATVYVGSRAVSIARLDTLLGALKATNGEVWYYRQPRAPGLTAAQDSLVDSVLSAIQRHELAVRISRRPDFSDQAGKRRRSLQVDRP